LSALAWAIVGALLLAVEVLAIGTWLLWFSLGAFTLALLLVLGVELGLEAQLLIYAAVTLAETVLVVVVWRRRGPQGGERLNERAERLVGQIFVLETPVVHGRGRIRVGDGSWPVRCAEPLPAGAEVRVTAADGSELTVVAHTA